MAYGFVSDAISLIPTTAILIASPPLRAKVIPKWLYNRMRVVGRKTIICPDTVYSFTASPLPSNITFNITSNITSDLRS